MCLRSELPKTQESLLNRRPKSTAVNGRLALTLEFLDRVPNDLFLINKGKKRDSKESGLEERQNLVL